MPRGRRKAAEQAPEEEPKEEEIHPQSEPNVYRFCTENPQFKPVEDIDLKGIAHTPRFSVSRQIPDMKYHTRCSDQIYAITRNGRELYFTIPNLPADLVINLWAAAKDNISVEDFLIELQTINGVRPIIFHTDIGSV